MSKICKIDVSTGSKNSPTRLLAHNICNLKRLSCCFVFYLEQGLEWSWAKQAALWFFPHTNRQKKNDFPMFVLVISSNIYLQVYGFVWKHLAPQSNDLSLSFSQFKQPFWRISNVHTLVVISSTLVSSAVLWANHDLQLLLWPAPETCITTNFAKEWFAHTELTWTDRMPNKSVQVQVDTLFGALAVGQE